MAAHRYWRIYGIFSSGTYVGFAEIELRDVIGGADRTGSGTATASASNAGNPPSLAVDNNNSTLWTSYSSVAPQWWQYDFGAGNAFDIVQVVITPRQDGSFYTEAPQYFTIEYSDDGSTWVIVAYVVKVWASAAAATFNVADYAAGAVPHDFTSNTSHAPYVITASSSSGAGVPWKMLNRSDLYGWLSAAEPAWWEIDLGVPATFSTYALQAGTLGDGNWLATKLPKDWILEGSNNNSTWTTIDTVTGATGWNEAERRTYTIDSPGSYRYYRITITANNGYVGGTGKDYIAEIFFFASTAVTGAATLAARPAAIAAGGTVAAVLVTATGVLVARAAAVSATGAVTMAVWTGSGALVARAATLRANGTAGRRPVTPGGGGSLPAGPTPAKGKSMSTTVSDLIHSAMRLIGAIAAGETLETVELNDAFVTLNQMLASWNTEGASLVARKKLTLFIAALNAYSLPERPVRIDAASSAISGVDSALDIVDAAGWEAIPIPEKAMQSIFLRKLYCDYGFPTATVYVWPIPRVAGQLELWIYATVPPFQTLNDPINLPDGYEAGLRWNLAVNLAPEYGRPLDQVVAAQAQGFKASLVQLNAGNHMKSQAQAPAGAAQ